MKTPFELFGWEIGDGWKPLVTELIKDLKELKWNGTILQIKEKFGGLRFYIGEGSELIFNRINKAESDSYKICEECGVQGKLRQDLPWIKTLCEEHYNDEISRRAARKSKNSC